MLIRVGVKVALDVDLLETTTHLLTRMVYTPETPYCFSI